MKNTPEDLVRKNVEFMVTQKHYQAELARLLQLSTLSPGKYTPSDQVRIMNHAAVFVNEAPVLLCGPSDDSASVVQAKALAASHHVRIVFRAAGMSGVINSGVVSGKHVQWQDTEAAIVSKSSGKVELGGDDGLLVAIVLNDSKQAITTSFCITTTTARIFSASVPELDDGHKLPTLARLASKLVR